MLGARNSNPIVARYGRKGDSAWVSHEVSIRTRIRRTWRTKKSSQGRNPRIREERAVPTAGKDGDAREDWSAIERREQLPKEYRQGLPIARGPLSAVQRKRARILMDKSKKHNVKSEWDDVRKMTEADVQGKSQATTIAVTCEGQSTPADRVQGWDQKLNSTVMTREHEKCELERCAERSFKGACCQHTTWTWISTTTAKELQNHATKTQDTWVSAVENAEECTVRWTKYAQPRPRSSKPKGIILFEHVRWEATSTCEDAKEAQHNDEWGRDVWCSCALVRKIRSRWMRWRQMKSQRSQACTTRDTSSDSPSPHTPPQEPLETHHCAKRSGQKTMSTLAKLAKIDEKRNIGRTTPECQLAV